MMEMGSGGRRNTESLDASGMHVQLDMGSYDMSGMNMHFDAGCHNVSGMHVQCNRQSQCGRYACAI